jgi:hypothetical protein
MFCSRIPSFSHSQKRISYGMFLLEAFKEYRSLMFEGLVILETLKP